MISIKSYQFLISYFLRRDGLIILPQTFLDCRIAVKRLGRAGWSFILWIVYSIGTQTPARWLWSSTATGTSTITRAIDQYLWLLSVPWAYAVCLARLIYLVTPRGLGSWSVLFSLPMGRAKSQVVHIHCSCHGPLCTPRSIATIRSSRRLPPWRMDYHNSGFGVGCVTRLFSNSTICSFNADAALRARWYCPLGCNSEFLSSCAVMISID